jgi:predicted PurR-regulated permease PerM
VEAGGPVPDDRAADGEGSAAGDSEDRRAAPAGPATAQASLTPTPHPQPPVVVPRWIQLVILPLGILGLWALARASGSVLLILIVAGTVALILAPTIRFLEMLLPRGVAIFVVYLGGFAVIAGIGVLLASPVTTQISRFEHNLPEIVRHANTELANIQTFLNNHGIHVHITKQGSSALDTLPKNVLK